MSKIKKIKVATGIFWIEISDADIYVLCGCPADSVKHLMKKGQIMEKEENGVRYETGPNVILLSDILVQNGSFANLAEFPVLQMLYRQGMLLPGHPNNTGLKPLLLGSEEQVKSQLQYIYRGNYGLISKEEFLEAGVTPEKADELLRVKLKFAFGNIRPTSELLDHKVVTSKPVEIRNDVFVKRIALNRFELSYMGESVTVDLNLSPLEDYDVPYPLGFHNINREYFSIVHTGEGDGWDINRPCMSSILLFQGKVYLIDAGPNITHSLRSLGIGINEIDGIFHTHAHDDHFAGLMTLMRSDHKIKYFSTPLVRASVTKKLSALASIDESHFRKYFEIHDLWADAWNEVDALEVKPVISPHPVETTIFFFRAMGDEGYSSYAHLADIVSKRTLESMITSDDSREGVSQQHYDSVWNEYMAEADIKKLDIGGGLIHGEAADFADDRSGKIILSHVARDLDNDEKKIGSGAPFGMADVLISAHQEFIRRYAFNLLSSYFPTIAKERLSILLNNPLATFNPETIIMKAGEMVDNIYIILTGNVEVIKDVSQINSILSTGGIAGEFAGLKRTALSETYRSMNFVNALKVSANLYSEFVMLNEVYDDIILRIERQDFLQHIWLFNEALSYSVLSEIISCMVPHNFAAGDRIQKEKERGIYVIKEGRCEIFLNDDKMEMLDRGDFFFESTVLFGSPDLYQVRAINNTEAYFIGSDTLENIPIVQWKLFELYNKRLSRITSNGDDGSTPNFQWKEEYSVSVQEIDADHKRMLEAAEKLNRAIEIKENREVLNDILDFLITCTREHFKKEEDMMKSYFYPDVEEHAKKHAKLTEEVLALKNTFDAGEIEMDSEFINFLQSWIIDHILTEDMQCGTFLNHRSIY